MPFIVFEGLDGSGKTTQLKLLAEKIRPPVVVTREPGGCTLSEKIRDILKSDSMETWTELFLILAARYEHLHTTVSPALRKKQFVLCDRFVYSTYAYQSFAKGIKKPSIDTIHKMLRIPKPDMVFFFPFRYRKSTRDKLEEINHDKVLSGFEATLPSNHIRVPAGSTQQTHKYIAENLWKQYPESRYN